MFAFFLLYWLFGVMVFMLLVVGVAADNDTPPDREKNLELIRYLLPEVFNGSLVDSLSSHALNAAGVAVSYLLEGEEQARLPAPPLSICSVIKAQKPGL